MSDSDIGAGTPQDDPAASGPEWAGATPSTTDQGVSSETPGPAPGIERRRRHIGMTALLFVLGLLIIALLAAGGAALKLWSDREAAQEALVAAVGTLSWPGGEAGSDAAGRLRQIREAAADGRYNDVARGLQDVARGGPRPQTGEGSRLGLSLPLSGVGTGLPGATGETRMGGARPDERPPAPAGAEGAPQFPPGVMEFLQKHRELGERLGRAGALATQLKERGGDVDRLREIRDSIMEAARLEDADRVATLINDFETELEKQVFRLTGQRPPGPRPPAGRRPPPGRGPPRPPRELITTARQVNQAMSKAQAEGKDLRQAMVLFRRADQAGAAGDFGRSLALSKQALRAIAEAESLPPAPELFRNPLVEMLLDLLRIEDRDLLGVLSSLKESVEDAADKTTHSLSGAIQRASEALSQIGSRRKAFSQRLERVHGGEPLSTSRENVEAEVRERMQQARGTVGEMLAQVRQMTDAEFEANTDRVIDEILEAVFPTPGQPQPGSEIEPAAPGAVREFASDISTRVRQKLLIAVGPYLAVRDDPLQADLTAQLEELFKRARRLLAAGQYAEAEESTDEGLELLGILDAAEAAEPEEEQGAGDVPDGAPIEPRETSPDSTDEAGASPETSG